MRSICAFACGSAGRQARMRNAGEGQSAGGHWVSWRERIGAGSQAAGDLTARMITNRFPRGAVAGALTNVVRRHLGINQRVQRKRVHGRVMDPGIALFDLADKRLAWVDHRQEVLAQNIANANTPGWLARDLAPFARAWRQDRRGPGADRRRTLPERATATARGTHPGRSARPGWQRGDDGRGTHARSRTPKRAGARDSFTRNISACSAPRSATESMAGRHGMDLNKALRSRPAAWMRRPSGCG